MNAWPPNIPSATAPWWTAPFDPVGCDGSLACHDATRGVPQGIHGLYVDYQDNVDLPPQSSTVIRMRPLDFTGKFVLHCHVTFHEDRGMMAAVQVVRSPSAAQRRASSVRDAHLSIRSSAYGASKLPPLAVTAAYRLVCRLLASGF